jgi:hypothetical protein
VDSARHRDLDVRAARHADGQCHPTRQESRGYLLSHQKGDWNIPARLIAQGFEDVEREVLRERFSLHRRARPVPDATVEG